MNTQPEALRLAALLDDEEFNMSSKDIFEAAAELRRLHKENEELRQAPSQPEQEPVAWLMLDQMDTIFGGFEKCHLENIISTPHHQSVNGLG